MNRNVGLDNSPNSASPPQCSIFWFWSLQYYYVRDVPVFKKCTQSYECKEAWHRQFTAKWFRITFSVTLYKIEVKKDTQMKALLCPVFLMPQSDVRLSPTAHCTYHCLSISHSVIITDLCLFLEESKLF